jgi:hypothetical protein
MNNDKWFMYYQRQAESKWVLADAADRSARSTEAELCTFLDLNTDLEHPREAQGLKYRGPMVFDLDDEAPADCIKPLHELLGKLKANGVNLNAVSLYCSGGKGFHVVVPAAMFTGAMEAGYTDLPRIYREMAHSLYVSTLDLRIYSGGKGRMWRNPNIKRANGCYKVQITAAEAYAMSEGLYLELIQKPRPPIAIEPPAFAPGLALLFTQARNKAQAGARIKRKGSALADAMNKRFKPLGAALPPSLLGLASGQIKPRPGLGWNQIAIQLCTVAVHLDVKEEDLVTLCRGLLLSHQGNSYRYNTPKKREMELRNVFHSVAGGLYDLSVGGLLSILPRNLPANDLRGF